MKKGFIRTAGEQCDFGQSFGIFDTLGDLVTAHFCSNSGYAEYDLLRHSEAKDFDIIYGLNGSIVYMNGEISDSSKKSFNETENIRWNNNHGTTAPVNHLVS